MPFVWVLIIGLMSLANMLCGAPITRTGLASEASKPKLINT